MVKEQADATQTKKGGAEGEKWESRKRSGETNSTQRKMERGVCKEREGRSWKTVDS